MHIGLIGGIGPAATDFYYRRFIDKFSKAGVPLELTIVHADTPTLLRHLAANDVGSQVAIFMKLTQRLVAAGADFVVVTSIAGHFCIDAFKKISPLPTVDLIEEVARHITEQGYGRIGILGTATVMQSRLYGAQTGAEIIPPSGPQLQEVHQAYIAMAASGLVTQAQRDVFNRAGERLMGEAGAEAIMLGGTDLALAFNKDDSAFPLIDCAGIHADAATKRAMGLAFK